MLNALNGITRNRASWRNVIVRRLKTGRDETVISLTHLCSNNNSNRFSRKKDNKRRKISLSPSKHQSTLEKISTNWSVRPQRENTIFMLFFFRFSWIIERGMFIAFRLFHFWKWSYDNRLNWVYDNLYYTILKGATTTTTNCVPSHKRCQFERIFVKSGS